MNLLGQAYEGLLKYKDAYNCFKQCYLLDTMRIDMLYTMARISANLGKTGEAEKYYKMVLETDSADFYANYQLGRMYMSLEKYGEAFPYFLKLESQDQTNAVIYRAAGDCFMRIGYLDLALIFYQDAYNLNMENASTASVLIHTLLKLRNPLNEYVLEAQNICDTALFYNPEHITLRQLKAMTCYLQKDFEKADSLYTALLAAKDSSFLTLKYCGFTRFYSQQWYQALEPLEKAFELDSTALDVCVILGITLGRTYDPTQSFQFFNKADSLMAPDAFWSEQLLQYQAEMYIKTGNCNKGAEIYYQLWLKDKTKLEWLLQMQNCYFSRTWSALSENEKQRYLFICHLRAVEILKNTDMPNILTTKSYLLGRLKAFENDMLLREQTSLPMLSPDNKKSTLSIEALQELIDQLSIN